VLATASNAIGRFLCELAAADPHDMYE
jgi:hypothetical protein